MQQSVRVVFGFPCTFDWLAPDWIGIPQCVALIGHPALHPLKSRSALGLGEDCPWPVASNSHNSGQYKINQHSSMKLNETQCNSTQHSKLNENHDIQCTHKTQCKSCNFLAVLCNERFGWRVIFINTGREAMNAWPLFFLSCLSFVDC